MKEILLRMVLGGTLVPAFALLGDIFKPKRFAGLFGAAPSVALATLALTAETEGKLYAAMEARSMIGGAIAFFVLLNATEIWIVRRFGMLALAALICVFPLAQTLPFAVASWYTALSTAAGAGVTWPSG